MSSLMGDSSSLDLAEEAEKRTSWLAAGMEMVLTEAGQHTAGGPEALNSLSGTLCSGWSSQEDSNYEQGRLWGSRGELASEAGPLRNP